MKKRLQTLGGFLFLALPFILLAIHAGVTLPLSAQPSHQSFYNTFQVTGTIYAHQTQTWRVPGPGGGLEKVCFLAVIPFEQSEFVILWMQGGAVPLCEDWGKNRLGDWIQASGFHAAHFVNGQYVAAAKPVSISVSDL